MANINWFGLFEFDRIVQFQLFYGLPDFVNLIFIAKTLKIPLFILFISKLTICRIIGISLIKTFFDFMVKFFIV